MKGLDGLSRPLASLAGRATTPRWVKNELSGTWLGHPLYPTLTDLPIGGWVMASAFDWTMGRRGARGARRLVGLGSRCRSFHGRERSVRLVGHLCRDTASGSRACAGKRDGSVLQSWSWLARRQGRRLTGMMLSTAGLGVTVGAAYLGGHLSFVRGVGVDHTAFEAAVTEWTDVAAPRRAERRRALARVGRRCAGHTGLPRECGARCRPIACTPEDRSTKARSSTTVCAAPGTRAPSRFATGVSCGARRRWTSLVVQCASTGDGFTCGRPLLRRRDDQTARAATGS